MKKAIIIAIILIALGVIISAAALVLIDFDFTVLSTVEMTEGTLFVDGDFEDLLISTTESDLIIRRSADGKCRLEYTTRKGNVFSAEASENVLIISEADAPGGKWYDNIGIWWEDSRAVLYLPEQSYESIKANTVSGDISLHDDFYFGYIEAESISGDIKILSDTDGQMAVKTTSGDIFLSKRKCEDISANTTSGDIELSGVVSSGEVMLKSTSGDIELNGCDGASITINTVSGDVEGSFISPKSFSVDTVSGDIDIPRRSTGTPCTITTVSGDIEIE